MRIKPSPKRPHLDELIERAKTHVMTDEERREQAVSFVFGNLPEENTLTKDEVREHLRRSFWS